MAFYDPNNKTDKANAERYLASLLSGDKLFEIRKVKKFSSPLNRYLHLIIGKFAIEIGETLEYTKVEYFKKAANGQFFIYDRVNKVTGEVRQDVYSIKNPSIDLPLCIGRFRDYSLKNMGVYLPEPNEKDHLRELEKEVKQHEEYL